MKLWKSKDPTTLLKEFDNFLTLDDKVFDLELAKYDVIGNIAHVKMLSKNGFLSKTETNLILNELSNLEKKIRQGTFKLHKDIEDIHSQVEYHITKNIGTAGKKIHTGRSRNDQVATDLRLFFRDKILLIQNAIDIIFKTFIQSSKKYQDYLIPGYTHSQVAMPSSIGLWLSSFAESLIDDLTLLSSAYSINNQNPLGTAAGYGSSFDIDRTFTTKNLQFRELIVNSIYAQQSRIKTEMVILNALSQISLTINRFCSDVCLFCNENYSFIELHKQISTGSSIMPHKNNPDVFELIRAKSNLLMSYSHQLYVLYSNLTTGYHRDYQVSKSIVFPALDLTHKLLTLLPKTLSYIHFKKIDIHTHNTYKNIYSVEAVNTLVSQGKAFRVAYQEVKQDLENDTFNYQKHKKIKHTHIGSLSHLCLDLIQKKYRKIIRTFK